MDREEAIRLLKGGIEGVREFNRRRDDGEELPSLEDADLENQQLSFYDRNTREVVAVNLSGARLVDAKLSGVNLHGANLSRADFSNANLSGANLSGANLSRSFLGANLSGADLEQANLSDASLADANLSAAFLNLSKLNGANVRGANLSGAHLRAANLNRADLQDSNLSDADLRRTKGLCLDNTFIRHARFDARAKDRWSVLRRSYTGPALLFNFVFLCMFLGVYAAKAAFWIGINRSQQAALTLAEKLAATHPQLAENLRALEPTLTEHSQKMPVWQVLMAMYRGPWMMILAVVIIVYNAVRWLLTRQVAGMRDAEERSGFSPVCAGHAQLGSVVTWTRFDRLPTWVQAGYTAVGNECRGYRWCWRLHAWISRPLFWIAVLSFLWHAWHWLSETVYLPI